MSAASTDPSRSRSDAPQEGLTRTRLEERWRALADAMAHERLDALVVGGRGVIGNFGHLMYTCGYAPVLRTAFAVFQAGQLEPMLFVPSADDAEQVRSAGLIARVRACGEADHAGAGLATAVCAARGIADLRPRRVGLAGLRQHVTSADREAIVNVLDRSEAVDLDDVLRRLKSRKSPWEIAAVRRSLAIGRAAYDAVAPLLRPGVRAQEVVAELEGIARAAGARETLVFVDSRPRLNWRTTPTTLERGALVTVLVETADDLGYWVEQGGLFSIGAPSPDAAAVARACYRTLEHVQTAARPGAPAAGLAALLDEVAADERLAPGIVLGHGVGVDHDLPTLHRTDTSALEVGNVLSVHPHLRSTAAVGGAVADVLHVGGETTEALAGLPRTLTVIE